MLNKNEGTAENTSMEISDKLRIEAGRESDEEDANTSDFLFFYRAGCCNGRQSFCCTSSHLRLLSREEFHYKKGCQ